MKLEKSKKIGIREILKRWNQRNIKSWKKINIKSWRISPSSPYIPVDIFSTVLCSILPLLGSLGDFLRQSSCWSINLYCCQRVVSYLNNLLAPKIDESGWNWWKWINVDESGWRWMKVDENLWKWMKSDENG